MNKPLLLNALCKTRILMSFIAGLLITANSFAQDCTVPSYDDFETNRSVTYVYKDGTLTQSVANPSSNYVNSSTTCGWYVRNSAVQYDNLVMNCVQYGTGDFYRSGDRVFKLDVLTTAPVGTNVTITLLNSGSSGLTFPAGRHSVYTATTTKTNQWETLVFAFSYNPDVTTPGDLINQAVIQFAPNTFTNYAFYFDNFTSTWGTAFDDFDFVRNLTYVFEDGVLAVQSNITPDVVNSTRSCATYTRNSNAQFDNIVATLANPGISGDFIKNGYAVMKMAIYSPSAGIPVRITLGNHALAGANPYPQGRHSIYDATTTVANQWEVLTFVYSTSPDPTVNPLTIDEFVIQINPGVKEGSTYKFDNFIVYPVKNTNPTSAISGTSPVCQGQQGVTYSVTNIANNSFVWKLPVGAAFNGASNTNSITVDFNSQSSGIKIAVKSVNASGCASPWTEKALTINSTPKALPGTNQSKCLNNPVVSLNGTVSNGATGGSWISSGSGTFANANSLATTYTPSAADKSSGSIILTLTPTGSTSPCTPVPSSITITFTPSPTVDAGPDQNKCTASPNATLTGTFGGGANGAAWSSSGTGTFSPNKSTLNAVYQPSAADIAGGNVTLTLTTYGIVGYCIEATDQMKITYGSGNPTANAGSNQTTCGNMLNISATIGGSATGGNWTSSGTGTFGAAGNLSTTFTPSNADIASGSVILTFTTTGGTCAATSQKTITFLPPLSDAGSDQIKCSSSPNAVLSGTVSGSATSGGWSTSGNGTFTPSSTSLNATYLPSPTDISGGSVTLTLTTLGTGGCTPFSDQMIITYTAAATANAGADQAICGNASASLGGTIGGSGTGGTWTSSGSGTFTPNNTSLNATYTPSSSDVTTGLITLTLTSTGGCSVATDQMKITYSKITVPSAGGDQTKCGLTAATLNGTVSNGGTASWSTNGTGIFTPSETALNATYTPSSADVASGSAILTLATTAGACASVSDQVTIIYKAASTSSAGQDQSLCSSTQALLSGTIGGTATGGVWTSSGTGTFSNATSLTNIYSASSDDVADGSVTITLTTTGGSCNAGTDQMVITFTSTSTANAGNDQSICGSNLVQLSGSVSGGATTGTWSTNGSGTFVPNATTATAVYQASSADISAGTVTLTYASSGGTCASSSDNMIITFTSASIADAGEDFPLCSNSTAGLSGSVGGGATGGTWSTSGSGLFIPNNTTLNATYIPSSSDVTAGSVTLTLTTVGGSCTTVADQVVVDINSCTGILGGNHETNQILVYPNPSNGPLSIDLSKANGVNSVAVFNVIGEKVSEIELNSGNVEEINLGSLDKGFYYLIFTGNDNKRMVKKIVLN